MHAAEVVVRKMNGDSGFKVLRFLRESIRQARKAAKRHARSEVLALHVAGGDVSRTRIADSHFGYSLDHGLGEYLRCQASGLATLN